MKGETIMSEETSDDAIPEMANPRGRPRGRPATVAGREQTHGPIREATGRAERVPLGSHRLKLTSSPRPGFVRRWVNDMGARVQYALQGGYTFVRKDGTTAETTDPSEAAVSQIAGTKEGGQSFRAYLMEIPQEWHAADQAAKHVRIDEQEAQIKRGKDEHGEAGQDGRYLREGAKRIGL